MGQQTTGWKFLVIMIQHKYKVIKQTQRATASDHDRLPMQCTSKHKGLLSVTMIECQYNALAHTKGCCWQTQTVTASDHDSLKTIH